MQKLIKILKQAFLMLICLTLLTGSAWSNYALIQEHDNWMKLAFYLCLINLLWVVICLFVAFVYIFFVELTDALIKEEEKETFIPSINEPNIFNKN